MKTSYEINFDIFNFLRFIALFCVLGTHARIVIYQNLLSFRINDSFEWWMYTPAWLAMSMFFILSGYLLGKGFYNERYRTDFYGMLNFWISRFIRIVPIYWFTILITFLFIAPEKFVVDQGKTLIPMLTFIYNGSNGIAGLGHFWFVSTIMQLYLIAPLVYKFVFVKFAKHNLLVFWGVFFYGCFFVLRQGIYIWIGIYGYIHRRG